jgi:large subunit ribosomal protein L12e
MPPKVDPTEKKFSKSVLTMHSLHESCRRRSNCCFGPCPQGRTHWTCKHVLNPQPPKKVGEDIQKATMDWRGIKIPIEIMVLNRVCTVTILPAASPLLIKALKEGPRDRKKVKNVKHDGNVKLDEVIEIAKKCEAKSMSKTFTGSVKQVLGTAVSIGCTVDGKDPRAIQKLIDEGEIEIKR